MISFVSFLRELAYNLNNSEANTQAHIINSHAKSPTDKLGPLLNTSHVTCEELSATLAELDELDGK